jgi:lycopene beta-cyclase
MTSSSSLRVFVLLCWSTATLSFTSISSRCQTSRRLAPSTRAPLLFSSSSTTPNDPSPEDDVVDVLICGAGPGGLLLASALSKQGCKVHVVDPAFDKPWPNNYGVWMDEADHFGYGECCDFVWKQAGVVFDEDTPELVLERPYGRIDRKRLKARLVKECNEQGVSFECTKATNIQHFDAAPSIVTLSNESLKQALLVVDATGFSKRFVKHEDVFDPGYQVTYGARYRVKEHPYALDRMVLMDYSERHLYSDPSLTKSNERFPSFVYIMPLAKDEIFMEETILVSRPGGSSRDLQQRLELRMKALGIVPLEVLEDERAAIPMGGMDPIIPQRTLGFGATCSLVHPASGYMVARAMEVAPRVAAAIAPAVKGLSSANLQPGQLDQVAETSWDAIWPTDERRQRDFMHFGFELLCLLNPQELRDFFTGFFKLPNGLWEHFLSWRLSGIGHIVMGLRVWAQCIPRRFMPPMLIKSIPFLGNRLIGPGLSRGNFAQFDTTSVYADAQTGNSSLWEPENFYPYLQDLSQRDYDTAPGETKEQSLDSPPATPNTKQKTTA